MNIEIPKISLDLPKIRDGEEDAGVITIPKLGGSQDSELIKKKRNIKAKLLGLLKGLKDHRRSKLLLVIVGLSLLIIVVGAMLFIPIAKNARDLQISLSRISTAFQQQDIGRAKDELPKAKKELGELKGAFNRISLTRHIPYFGEFVSDIGRVLNAVEHGIEAGEIIIETLEPYADIVGLVDEANEIPRGVVTAQDRLQFIVKSLPDLIEKTDELLPKVEAIQAETNQIDEDKYPESVLGYEIRSNIESAKKRCRPWY